MVKRIKTTLQIAAVFIGTIVGAGLASGEEITIFFTKYGYKSFLGILVCFFIYVFMAQFIVDTTLKYNLSSYNEFIKLISPNFFGDIIEWIMGFYLLAGAAIILAGSGSLIHQYFGISKWVGIIVMSLLTIFTLYKDTEGLVTINSFIVPSLIFIIIFIFTLYLLFSIDVVNYTYIKSIPYTEKRWFISALLYAGFNIISCSGVLVPLSNELKEKNTLKTGVIIGSIVLTIIALILNFMLLLNTPNIFKYDIPLLYIANRFGFTTQVMLLCIIWLEMFSTEVSDVYSICKTIHTKFKVPYNASIILIIIAAIPISQIGFVRLISYIYPAFGAISIVFLLQCLIFYWKN
ncbi:YkvI family membrane protein [Clostridium sp. DL1XJH146]